MDQELDQLEQRKLMLLLNLRNCVEKLAEEFMSLEDEILQTYDQLKAQIYDNVQRCLFRRPDVTNLRNSI